MAELEPRRRARHRPDHVLLGEPGERAVQRRERGEQVAVEVAAEHGGHVDHIPEPGELLEALGEQTLQGGRDVGALDARLEHLLDEQWHATGGREVGFGAPGEDHRADVLGREPVELDRLVGPPRRLELGPVRGHTQDRDAEQAAGDPAEQLDRRRIGPMQVLHHEQLRVGHDQRLELAQDRGAGVERREVGALDHVVDLQDGIERRAAVMRRALPDLRRADVIGQRADQPALPDARLARDVDDRAVSAGGLRPRRLEPRELRVAAHHRLHRTAVQPAAGEPQHPVHADRLRDAPELLLPLGGQLEMALDQRARGVTDQDRARRGDRFQALGDMRRRADDAALQQRVARACLARDHDAAVQADAHLDAHVQPRDLLDDRQPGVHGAVRVVLVRPRVAEVRQQPVAGPLRDPAVVALDRPGARVLVRRQDLAEVLGPERLSQRRRPDHVAEHDRQVATLCAVVGTGGRERTAAAAAEAHARRALQSAVRARQSRHTGIVTHR